VKSCRVTLFGDEDAQYSDAHISLVHSKSGRDVQIFLNLAPWDASERKNKLYKVFFKKKILLLSSFSISGDLCVYAQTLSSPPHGYSVTESSLTASWNFAVSRRWGE
jgi:hypothetical protein